MKLILTILLFILFTVSYNQQNGDFSCDPVLNGYVSTHVNKLKSLSINDLTNSDLVFQQAVFRSYDAGKKLEIWLQKIQLLLDTQSYTEAEYTHVASLLNHLHENYFVNENLKSEANVRKQFAVTWISMTKYNLGWTDKDVAFVVYRLYTNKKQFETEINSSQNNTIDTIDPAGNCTCNTSSSFCNNLVCNSGSCNITTGCGWL